MILYFKTTLNSVIATEVLHELSAEDVQKLSWLYGNAQLVNLPMLEGFYVGPRKEMVTPWSTNAVEITQNMNLNGILRIEEFFPVPNEDAEYDPMLQQLYNKLGQDVFLTNNEPAAIQYVENIETYNEAEGLALSQEEIAYLHEVEKQLDRRLTDSEVFGFAQINSEHCRHKIFGGTFVIDGKEMPSSLFSMIKRTTNEKSGNI